MIEREREREREFLIACLFCPSYVREKEWEGEREREREFVLICEVVREWQSEREREREWRVPELLALPLECLAVWTGSDTPSFYCCCCCAVRGSKLSSFLFLLCAAIVVTKKSLSRIFKLFYPKDLRWSMLEMFFFGGHRHFSSNKRYKTLFWWLLLHKNAKQWHFVIKLLITYKMPFSCCCS